MNMNDFHQHPDHSLAVGVPEHSFKIGIEDDYKMPVKGCGSQQRVTRLPERSRDESDDPRSHACLSTRSNSSQSISDYEPLSKEHKQNRRVPRKRSAYKSKDKKEETSFELCLKNRSNSSISISDLSDEFDEDDGDWSSGLGDESFDQTKDLAEYVISTLLKTSAMNHNSFDFSLKHRKNSLLREREKLHPRSSQRTRRSRCDLQGEEYEMQLNQAKQGKNPNSCDSSINDRERSIRDCPHDEKVVETSSELASIVKESTSQVEGMLSLLLQRQAVVHKKNEYNVKCNTRHSI